MPIILNNSNIEIQYNTGSSYIIETVKSDLYVRGTTSGNLSSEPTVSPTITSNLAVFTHSGGTENQTPHTIYFPENTVCDILIVGGGGGGGFAGPDARGGGGGGAGQFLLKSNYSLNAGTYNINVGRGGLGGTITTENGEIGKNSSITTSGNTILLESSGGGGGARGKSGTLSNGLNGASGGGGCGDGEANRCLGGTALIQFVNNNIVYTGYNGANGGPAFNGGGGGGYTSAGFISTNTNAGDGGYGITNNITGVVLNYCAGGGGGGWNDGVSTGTRGGYGGNITAGNGGNYPGANGGNATNGSGSGGGGAGVSDPGGSAYSGGNGGSGIVIIKVISPTTNKYLFFNYLPAQPTLNYTLNFPTRTMVNFVNSGDEVMNGEYTVSVRTTQSTITPTQGQNLQDRLYFTSNLAIRYHTLNPIKTDEGAQWTYSSNNPNVYHLGSVGIGTTSPEYSLDVRGFIYSSSGGYTSSALTKWSVLSDRRIKENIVKASYDKCLENVKNIELYNFNFKDNYVNTNDRHQLGFIAQEVQQVYPKAVEFSRMIMNLEEKIDDLLTLNTTQIDYTLYGAVKCLIQKLENIKIKMEQIKTVYNITT